jgi:hypothetical protein
MADSLDWLDESVPAWLADYAKALGVDPPTEDEIEHLLALAGVAAHASQRQAAPIATWLSAKAGVSATRALELAHAVQPKNAE